MNNTQFEYLYYSKVNTPSQSKKYPLLGILSKLIPYLQVLHLKTNPLLYNLPITILYNLLTIIPELTYNFHEYNIIKHPNRL